MPDCSSERAYSFDDDWGSGQSHVFVKSKKSEVENAMLDCEK